MYASTPLTSPATAFHFQVCGSEEEATAVYRSCGAFSTSLLARGSTVVQEWSPSEMWRSSLRQFWGDARLKERAPGGSDGSCAFVPFVPTLDHVHPAAAAKAPTVIHIPVDFGSQANIYVINLSVELNEAELLLHLL